MDCKSKPEKVLSTFVKRSDIDNEDINGNFTYGMEGNQNATSVSKYIVDKKEDEYEKKKIPLLILIGITVVIIYFLIRTM